MSHLEMMIMPKKIAVYVQRDQKRCFVIVLFAISLCALVVQSFHHLLLLIIPRLTLIHLGSFQVNSPLLARFVELMATEEGLIYV